MVRFIQTTEIEKIARRVWNARSDKASRNAFGEKVASFEAMGFQGQSTEFPMRSGEWTLVGPLEISISYPKWDIPGFIRVRKPVAVAVPT